MVPAVIHVNLHHRRKFLILSVTLVLVVFVTFQIFGGIGDLSSSSSSLLRARIVLASKKIHQNVPIITVINPESNEIKERLNANKLAKDKKIYGLKSEWFLDKCLGVKDIDGMSFDFIDDYLKKMSKSEVEECRVAKFIFTAMFDMEVMIGPIEFGVEFKSKMLKWLNNNEKYLEQSRNQRIIKIYNKYYKDEMIYNSLRGKRPVSTGSGQSTEKNYMMSIIEESRKSCDFCENSYKTNTANDVFDRLETKLSYSSANAFKYDKWHSLISSRNHNPLNLTEEELTDLFSLSLKWFQKVNDLEPIAQYPQIMWDAMPKSGASQVHPHLQVSMGMRAYYGCMRRWLEASGEYFLATYRDFFDDFLLIHKSLGLVYELNDSYVILNIIPIKDQEVMIVGKSFPGSYTTVVKLIHQVTRIFIDKFEQYSLSSGIYLPKYDKKQELNDNNNNKEYDGYNPGLLSKISARILFRSSSNMIRSDFNGLDLYTSSVIGVDRYALAAKLFKELELMNK